MLKRQFITDLEMFVETLNAVKGLSTFLTIFAFFKLESLSYNLSLTVITVNCYSQPGVVYEVVQY